MKKYPKYKPTGIEWIGEIPEHWIVSKLKYEALVQPSNVDKKSVEGEFDIRLCNYLDVYKNEFIDSSFDFMQATATKEEITKFTIKQGDVLVTKDSETPDDIAKPALVIEEFENVLCGYHLTQIRTTRINLYGEYLFRLFEVPRFNGQFQVYANGVTRYGLSIYCFSNAYIFLPPIPEQNAIANFLDEKTALIDSFIEKKKKLIELLKEERQAVINQAVTKGINSNVKMKPSGIDWLGDIPEHWEVKKLKWVANINSPLKNKKFEKDSNEEVVFLPMEKVSEKGDINQEIKKKISEISSGFTYFEKNDIIIAKITPCFENGKGALLNDLETNFGFGSTEFHTIRTTISVLKEFIYYISKSERFMTIGETFMTGSAGQKRVPTDFIKEFIIGFPKVNEQTQIVVFIETEIQKIDNTITKIEKEIELIQEYRTALISEVVTGKVRVV